MSAYMLSADSFALLSNAIVGIYETDRVNGSRVFMSEADKTCLRKAAAKLCGNLCFDKSNMCRLLQDMNARALQARYGEDPSTNQSDPPTKWPAASTMQVYKGLSSFLYQCAEGDVPESRLYHTISSIQQAIGSAIITCLPEYEEAEWL